MPEKTLMHMLTSNVQNHSAIRRLRIIEGQVRGLQKMVAKETSRIDVVYQVIAVREALTGVENLIIEDYLSRIIDPYKVRGKEEILKMYHLKRTG